MKQIYKLNEAYKNFEVFLKNIKNHFDINQNSIHKARNELKIISYDGVDTIVKSFKIPNYINQVVYSFFRDSKAKKSYENSIKIGNFTPTPIGYIEFYNSSLLNESYFIAEKFIYDFTIKEPIVNKDLKDRDKILKAFAKFTYELHQNNIFHKDYSPGNILIKQDKEDYIFKIVDINRMEFKKLNTNLRLKNFAKLWIKDEDLKTIIKVYANLINEDEKTCIELALKYSHKLKYKINMKKRIKGIPVVD